MVNQTTIEFYYYCGSEMYKRNLKLIRMDNIDLNFIFVTPIDAVSQINCVLTWYFDLFLNLFISH